jgi:integrase
MARVDLTDRFVKHAKAGDLAQADFFDEGTPGLCLRVSSKGRKTWTYLFTDLKRTRARMTLGTYPAISLSSARTLALEAKGHAEQGRDPRDVLAARDASALTVAGLAENYLAKHVRPNLRSAGNFEQRVKKNVLPVIGSVRLADLHARHINLVTDAILAREAPTECNRVFEHMRAMLAWACRRGDLDRSPIERMLKPAPEGAPRQRVLSDDEIRHLWHILTVALAQSKAGQRIVRLCLITGQRVGEVCGMRADELNLKAGTWSLPGSRTKNGNPHEVPLSLMAIQIIKDSLQDAGDKAEFVFPSPTLDDEGRVAAIDPHAISTTLRRAHAPTEQRPRGRFDMVPFTAHDLRRTVLTGLAQLGQPPIVIGAVANHLSVTKASVTFINYVRHSYAEEKRRALELWADRLAAIIGGPFAATVAPINRRANAR